MISPRVFLDLETTGTDPRKNSILEWGILITTTELEVLEQHSGCVHFELSEADAGSVDPVVIDMHTENGLWACCRAASAGIENAESSILSALDNAGIQCRIELAGFSVHFDLSFIRAHMPSLAKRMSHRVFDVSTLRSMVREWRGIEIGPTCTTSHRALADCHEALEYTRAFRATFMGAAP